MRELHRPPDRSTSWRRGSRSPSLREALRGLAALLWPGPCLGCGEDLPGRAAAGVCLPCWAELPLHDGEGCRRCALPLHGDGPCPDCRAAGAARRRLEATVAALVYRDTAVRLHRALKFGGAAALARPLGRLMAAAWAARGPFRPDLLVPIPPGRFRWGPRREAVRRLAREAARRLGVPLGRHRLMRWRFARAQTRQGAAARRALPEGTFRAPLRLDGMRVVIVDDVATTGATLREAARALRQAGAERVAALVLARTPHPAALPGAPVSG
ncbi:MAG: ComF family protein [Acidobacteria bacterium]|nr:MAG: ComF family protein [Acidobacteriota bacterium]